MYLVLFNKCNSEQLKENIDTIFRLAKQETLPIWVQQVLEGFCLWVTSVDISRVQCQWIFTCAVIQVSQNQLV